MNITLFNIDTSKPFSEFEKYMVYASPERQKKIQSYKFDRDKILSLFSHLLSRYKISRELNIPFSDITILYNDYGKPYIDKADFHFSVSHSKNLIAFVSHTAPIGIDIQKTEPHISRAVGFFTPTEQAYIGKDCERFFEIWTKKEAYVKMLGTGLSTSFKDFDVLSEDISKFFYTEKLDPFVLSVCTHDAEGLNFSTEKVK